MRGHKCFPNPSQPYHISVDANGVPIVNCTKIKNSMCGITRQTFTPFDAAVLYNLLYAEGAKVGKINDLLITFDGVARHWALKLERLGWRVQRKQIRHAMKTLALRKGSFGNGPSEQLTEEE